MEVIDHAKMLQRDGVLFSLCVSVANPEDRAQVVGDAGPAAMGVQPAHEHCGPVCAPTGSLGGGENGSLPPHLRAGKPFSFQKILIKQC